MSTALRERPASAGTSNGGVPARRAVIRWSWRMFRREWRQQLLVLALIVVALAATVVGAAVATNTPPPAGAGFGTAQDMATLPGGRHLASQIAVLQQHVGRVDVIENQTVAIPGSINTYDLRAQDPHGAFGQPMLSLVSGHYPAGPGQVAVTEGVASTFNLRIGDSWHQGGQVRQVTGIVQNPQSLLDEFALVAPGQVSTPSQVTVLFTAPRGENPAAIGSLSQYVVTRQDAAASNPLNPETIVLALATVGMLLIALVAVGGFTVLAQRRLRSLGMLGALGATDRNIRLVVRANGVLVGVVGALAGAILGLAVWLAYRPRLESSAHHLIGAFQLPWIVIGPAMALAVVATYFAASRPARAVTRIPVVAALSGRPAPPKQVHRSAIPGVVLFVVAAALFWYSGKSNNGGGAPELVGGFVALVVAMILLAPFGLAVLARSGRRAPIAVRLALRDLDRYRARSGSALAAISLGALIAVLVCVLTAQRYGNVLDYAGPNLASNQVIVYTPNGGPGRRRPGQRTGRIQPIRDRQHAAGPGGGRPEHRQGPRLEHRHRTRPGRRRSLQPRRGRAFLVRPDLRGHAPAPAGVRDQGVRRQPRRRHPDRAARAVRHLPDAARLRRRKGGGGGHGPQDVGSNSWPCPKGQCLANPVIQEVGALPAGTSAPNTVITEHAIHALGLQTSASGWLIQTPNPPTAAQITNARLTAGTAGMTIETKNERALLGGDPQLRHRVRDCPGAGHPGHVHRPDPQRDRQGPAYPDRHRGEQPHPPGADRRDRLRARAGRRRARHGGGLRRRHRLRLGNPLDGLSELSNVPAQQLLFILVGMPVVAAVIGWLMAGREPPAISRQPLE